MRSASVETGRQLFVLWHDRQQGMFHWIAALREKSSPVSYEFRYLPSVYEANRAGFQAIPEFPEFDRTYTSESLFPFFRNRLPTWSQPAESLGLEVSTPDALAILARTGGERPYDALLLIPEPIHIAPNRYELHFWPVLREGPWSKIQALKPDDLLKLEQGAHLLREGDFLGVLPDWVREVIEFANRAKTGLRDEPEIRVTRVNGPPIPSRYWLLCSLHWAGPVTQPALPPSHVPFVELPELGDARRGMPRAVVGPRIKPTLDALVVSLIEGSRPHRPSFPQPVRGVMAGAVMEDPSAAIEWQEPDHALRLSGTSSQQKLQFWSALAAGNYDGTLDLADQSSIHVEACREFTSNTRLQRRDGDAWEAQLSWRFEISGWRWERAPQAMKDVVCWVGVVDNCGLDSSFLNMGVSTLNSEYLAGLHIPAAPSLTLLPLGEAGSPQPSIAVLIEGNWLEADVEDRLQDLSTALTVTLGIPEPAIFYGYDNSQQICACLVRAKLPLSVRRELIHRSRDLMPVLPGPPSTRPSMRDPIWPVPFLSRLRDTLLRDRSLAEALVWLRFGWEEGYLPCQLGKLGVVVRLLLLAQPAACLDEEGGIDPGRTAEALDRLAQAQGLRFPTNSKKALHLAHRMALLGDLGISTSRIDRRSFYGDGEWREAFEILRVLVAVLLARRIGYHGPVVTELHPKRSSSSVYQPWSEDSAHEAALALQAEEANARFTAGEPIVPSLSRRDSAGHEEGPLSQ